jgi:single-strand DNA-binding protein
MEPKSPPKVAPSSTGEAGSGRSSGPNLNKVMLIGTLTRDPEVKTTPRGTSVAELGLAINRFYTTEGGERREETTFVDVELWGRQAEVAGEYLRKGRSVFVEGRLRLDSWDDKETGAKRSKLRVVGEVMQMLGGRADREQAGNGGYKTRGSDDDAAASRRHSRGEGTGEFAELGDDAGDVPF